MNINNVTFIYIAIISLAIIYLCYVLNTRNKVISIQRDIINISKEEIENYENIIALQDKIIASYKKKYERPEVIEL